MIIKYCLAILLVLNTATSALASEGILSVEEEKHLLVALRVIGHELLLSQGDSTSRILPITRENSQYIVPIETPFPFDPDDLVSLIEGIASSTDFPSQYIVEVEDYFTQEIVYSYAAASIPGAALQPCKGRVLPLSCYNLLFTFPGLQLPAIDTKAEARAVYTSQRGWYYLLGIPVFALLLYLILRPGRTSPASDNTSNQIGAFTFNRHSMKLSRNGRRETLTAKESELLALLFDHVNETLERGFLLETVWGDAENYVGRTLDVFISRLRKKLEADPEVQIANVRGVGYKLVVEV
jgi:hypothetical protein